MKIRNLLLLIFVALFCFGCNSNKKCENPKPKYFFLFIGDGMGVPQTQLGDAFLRADGDSLDFMYFPNRGFQTTWSLSSYITCSAASGTAMACGEKTLVDYIGCDSTGNPLKSLAYIAQEKGKKVGILTTVPIDHATPAVFYAHSKSRHSNREIDQQLPTSGFDFFGGGMFEEPIAENYNMFKLLQDNNYTLITSSDSLQYVPSLNTKICVLHPNTRLDLEIDNSDDKFTLAALTESAIKKLDNENGFFMMIEGGMIDWACHSNDAAAAAREVVGFNEAIKKAVEFYNAHPDETLIVITADHETGGLALGTARFPYFSNISLLKKQTVSYNTLEGIFMADIDSNKFTFDDCMARINAVYGNYEFDQYDISKIKKAYDFTMTGKTDYSDVDVKKFYNLSASARNAQPRDRCSAIVTTVNSVFDEHAGINWTTFAHTASQVPVSALGVGGEQFRGVIDNTEIHHKIKKMME